MNTAYGTTTYAEYEVGGAPTPIMLLPTSSDARSTYANGFSPDWRVESTVYTNAAALENIAFEHYMHAHTAYEQAVAYAEYENAMRVREAAFDRYVSAIDYSGK